MSGCRSDTETIISHGILPKSYTGGVGGGGGIGGAALPFGSGVSDELKEFQAEPDKGQAVVLKVRQGNACSYSLVFVSLSE